MNSNEKNNTNETSTNKQNNLETAEILEISKKSLRSNRSFGTIIGLELAIIIAILLMKNCSGINIDFGSKETKPTTIESEISTSADTTTSIDDTDDTDNGNISFPVVEQTWLISNNTKSVKLSNPALNDCDLVYEVVIDDKTIYKTENIKPNEEYNLNIYDNLEKGTYSANLNIYYVSKDSNLNKCGHQGITIVVS